MIAMKHALAICIALLVSAASAASGKPFAPTWNAVDARFPWFAFPLLGWGILLAVHGVYAFVMKTPEEIMIERERRGAERT